MSTKLKIRQKLDDMGFPDIKISMSGLLPSVTLENIEREMSFTLSKREMLCISDENLCAIVYLLYTLDLEGEKNNAI